MLTNSRDTEVQLLRKLWAVQPVFCPKCEQVQLEHLHKKAKKVIVIGNAPPVGKYIEPSIC